LREGTATELWRGHESRIAGGPAISPDGKHIAFSVRQQARTLLYTIDADGANVRLVTDALDLQGDPAWEPSGNAITIAAMEAGVPRLFRVPIGGDKPRRLSDEYGMNPAWAPGGSFAVHARPDIGTTFALKAVTATKTPYPLPAVSLTRGARRFVFQNGARSIVVLKGDIRHKDLWLIDLESGAERRLMQFPADFEVRDFDMSPDGNEIVLERVQDRSDIALMELKSP
jgi:Tol biopolymer transport system component